MMDKFNIKNYTSTVPAETSISKIEKILVKAGGNNILKTYNNGVLVGIQFTKVVNGIPVVFKIEAKTESIYNTLFKEFSRPTEVTKRNCKSQAERTAWKILSEWVEIQLTLINLEQADFIELFLAKSVNPENGKTFYNSFIDNEIKLLK